MKNKEINTFRDRHFFLSNFYPSKIIYNGLGYATAEHFFQSRKVGGLWDRRDTINASTPKLAKKQGRKVLLRSDWDEIKDDIMLIAVRLKFLQNKDLAEKLMETGETHLIEGNYWHDNYWGDCHCDKCKTKHGLNLLGYTLMIVRNELLIAE